MSLYHGLFVKASASPDMNVNWSEGLFGSNCVYTASGSSLVTSASTKGKVTSASSPATDDGAGLTFSVNVDGDGAQAISTDGNGTTGALIAAQIQAAVRALTANTVANQASLNAFTCTFTSSKYVLTSGSTGSGSSVVVTGAGAATLKIRVADGGVQVNGLDEVVATGKEVVGIVQVDSSGTVSLKWGTQVASSSGLAEHPVPDSGNFLLAKLFTAAAPLAHSASTISNSNIDNKVQNSEFGGR